MNTFLHRNKPGGVVRATGEDAQDYLQSQLSVNLSILRESEIRFGLRLNTKGKVLAGMYVLKISEEELLLISRKSKASLLVDLLEENVVADEIEFTDETGQWNFHSTWGDERSLVLERHGLAVPESGKFIYGEAGYAFPDSRLPGSAVSMLIREELDCDNPTLPLGVFIAQENELELARIRAGLVSIPDEIGPNDLPQEGGLVESSVDFDKGCYLGQEVMARLHAMGKARRQAVAIRWTGTDSISTPVDLYAGKKKVGELRSLIMENNEGVGIALIHENGIPSLKNDGLTLKDEISGKVTSS
jgi:tRNA-modifying protein YgfZ